MNKTSNPIAWCALAWTAAWLSACAIGSGTMPPGDLPGAPYRQPGTFILTPETTTATFTVAVVDLISVTGEFKKASGQLVLGTNGHPSRVEVDLASASAESGTDWINDILVGPRFFDAKQHPRLMFRSERFAGDHQRLDSVDGELTLRGIAKPVTLKVNRFDCRRAMAGEVDQRPRCAGEASASVKRTDFGMSSWLESVGESIKIEIKFMAFAQQ